MAQITFVTKDGQQVDVVADDGTLMTAATAQGVAGIEGECGGVCSCATCHVHVPPEWMDKVGPATEAEKALLEFEDDFNETSRLGCQIPIKPELDGLVVKVAER